MARYKSQLTSSAALASGTAFAWLGYSTTGFKLRRVILGVIAGTSSVASQQLQVGINPTHAGSPSVPVNATAFPMNSLAAASPANNLISAWTTPPTLNAADEITLTFNSQSGGDWPWEVPEDLWPPYVPAANVGFAFVNRANAMPAGASYAITLEWDE